MASLGESTVWMYRLFNSNHFDQWLCVSYLFRYSQNGLQYYLCRKLRLQNIDRCLPHLCSILAQSIHEDEFSYAIYDLLRSNGIQVYFLTKCLKTKSFILDLLCKDIVDSSIIIPVLLNAKNNSECVGSNRNEESNQAIDSTPISSTSSSPYFINPSCSNNTPRNSVGIQKSGDGCVCGSNTCQGLLSASQENGGYNSMKKFEPGDSFNEISFLSDIQTIDTPVMARNSRKSNESLNLPNQEICQTSQANQVLNDSLRGFNDPSLLDYYPMATLPTGKVPRTVSIHGLFVFFTRSVASIFYDVRDLKNYESIFYIPTVRDTVEEKRDNLFAEYESFLRNRFLERLRDQTAYLNYCLRLFRSNENSWSLEEKRALIGQFANCNLSNFRSSELESNRDGAAVIEESYPLDSTASKLQCSDSREPEDIFSPSTPQAVGSMDLQPVACNGLGVLQTDLSHTHEDVLSSKSTSDSFLQKAPLAVIEAQITPPLDRQHNIEYLRDSGKIRPESGKTNNKSTENGCESGLSDSGKINPESGKSNNVTFQENGCESGKSVDVGVVKKKQKGRYRMRMFFPGLTKKKNQDKEKNEQQSREGGKRDPFVDKPGILPRDKQTQQSSGYRSSEEQYPSNIAKSHDTCNISISQPDTEKPTQESAVASHLSNLTLKGKDDIISKRENTGSEYALLTSQLPLDRIGVESTNNHEIIPEENSHIIGDRSSHSFKNEVESKKMAVLPSQSEKTTLSDASGGIVPSFCKPNQLIDDINPKEDSVDVQDTPTDPYPILTDFHSIDQALHPPDSNIEYSSDIKSHNSAKSNDDCLSVPSIKSTMDPFVNDDISAFGPKNRKDLQFENKPKNIERYGENSDSKENQTDFQAISGGYEHFCENGELGGDTRVDSEQLFEVPVHIPSKNTITDRLDKELGRTPVVNSERQSEDRVHVLSENTSTDYPDKELRIDSKRQSEDRVHIFPENTITDRLDNELGIDSKRLSENQAHAMPENTLADHTANNRSRLKKNDHALSEETDGANMSFPCCKVDFSKPRCRKSRLPPKNRLLAGKFSQTTNSINFESKKFEAEIKTNADRKNDTKKPLDQPVPEISKARHENKFVDDTESTNRGNIHDRSQKTISLLTEEIPRILFQESKTTDTTPVNSEKHNYTSSCDQKNKEKPFLRVETDIGTSINEQIQNNTNKEKAVHLQKDSPLHDPKSLSNNSIYRDIEKNDLGTSLNEQIRDNINTENAVHLQKDAPLHDPKSLSNNSIYRDIEKNDLGISINEQIQNNTNKEKAVHLQKDSPLHDPKSLSNNSIDKEIEYTEGSTTHENLPSTVSQSPVMELDLCENITETQTPHDSPKFFSPLDHTLLITSGIVQNNSLKPEYSENFTVNQANKVSNGDRQVFNQSTSQTVQIGSKPFDIVAENNILVLDTKRATIHAFGKDPSQDLKNKTKLFFDGILFTSFISTILPSIIFLEELSFISERLKSLPKILRSKVLEIEIDMLNYNIRNAEIPIKIPISQLSVVNVLKDFSCVLDSAENAPFLVFFELADISTYSQMYKILCNQAGLCSKNAPDCANSQHGCCEKQPSQHGFQCFLYLSGDTLNVSNGKCNCYRKHSTFSVTDDLKSLRYDIAPQKILSGNLDQEIQSRCINKKSAMDENTRGFLRSVDGDSKAQASNSIPAKISHQTDQVSSYPNIVCKENPLLLKDRETPQNNNIASQASCSSPLISNSPGINFKNTAFLLHQFFNMSNDSTLVNGEIDIIKERIIDTLNQQIKCNNSGDNATDTPSLGWKDKKRLIMSKSLHKNLPKYTVMAAIVKRGNDLRQEILAQQILEEMKSIFSELDLNILLTTYKIFIISDKSAFIECIESVESIHSIKKRTTLKDYFKNEISQTIHGETGLDNFMRSLVGYSLATYLLQIKDRHNGNILIKDDGQIVHVDFGFILGSYPGFYNVERAPFKMSLEYMDLLGDRMDRFKSLFLEGFLALRRNSDRLCRIIEIISNKNFLGRRSTALFRERLKLDLGDGEIESFVDGLISWSLGSIGTGLYDSYQYFSHGYMK